MRHSIVTALFLLGFAGIALTGCNEEEAWRQTQLNDQADAYEEFLEKYPDSDHAAEAIKRVEEQEYVVASELGTADAYRKYLESHPEGSNSDDAKLNHARLLFEEAKSEVSGAKMEEYLRRYPEGASAADATHYGKVYRYAEHIAISEATSRPVNLQNDPEGPLDGHGIYAKVTNNGDANISTCQIRIEWLSEADVVLLQRLWYVATPPLDMYPTPEWMQVAMKPGETRDMDYEFGRSVKPDYWDGKVRLVVHDLVFEGEAEAVQKKSK
jgi:hypothetical protein